MSLKKSMIRFLTLGHNSEYSSAMTFDNTLHKVVFTGIESIMNMNASIIIQNIKEDSLENTTCCETARQSLCSWVHCSRKHRWFGVMGILYKGVRTNSPQSSWSRWIAESNSDTSVAVNHYASNCLDEAVRFISDMRSKYLWSRIDAIFRLPLLYFPVVRYSFVH